MTTTAQMVNEAVELVIAFGLDDDGEAAAENFRNGATSAQWVHYAWRSGKSSVAIDVTVRGKGLVVKIEPKVGKLSSDSAKEFSALMGRVAVLACQIEALCG
jgi:hypothetical protein